MKIYTKGGDRGQTGLYGGQRVEKDDLRVAAYGDVDELNATLGVARAGSLEARLSTKVARVQDELFTLGAVLATPADATVAQTKIPHIREAWVTALEQEIDEIDGEVPALRQFILPGGCAGAALLHHSRTVCRRAERSIVTLAHREALSPLVVTYMNRLSDWLFMVARAANHRAGITEPVWNPPKDP